MKITVDYLEKIIIGSNATSFFEHKFGKNKFDLLEAYNDMRDFDKVWFLGCAGVKEVKFLLDNSSIDINAVDNTYGWTALHIACARDNIDNVQLLLDNNADVNAKNNDGYTALHYTYDEKIKELLISKGAI